MVKYRQKAEDRITPGLYDRIILAIKREQELKKTRKLLLMFFTLLIVSVFTAPFSIMYFVSQWQNSNIPYLISAVILDLSLFSTLWQEFLLAILESLPIYSLVILLVNVALAIFTLRLFLRRKQILLRYFIYGFEPNMS